MRSMMIREYHYSFAVEYKLIILLENLFWQVRRLALACLYGTTQQMATGFASKPYP